MHRTVVRFALCFAVAASTLACVQPAARTAATALTMQPLLAYDAALARIALRQLADDSVVVRGGRSILLTHAERRPRIIVLLHGFTDSPTQFETLGRRFFDAGDNVYIPRLPHHAERVAPVRSLGRVRAGELASFGDSVIDVASALGDTVIVAGLSAGGAVAAYLAQTRREVRRVVLIAPAIAAGLISEDDEHGLVALAARLPNITRTNAPDTTRPDFVQGLTTRGLAEVLRLGQLVREKASDVPPAGAEMVFLLNELDRTVSEDASKALARSWSDHGAAVSIYRFPKALKLPHNVMEIPLRGGNPEAVLPVVVSLVMSTPPPPTVERQAVPCDGFVCAFWRIFR